MIFTAPAWQIIFFYIQILYIMLKNNVSDEIKQKYMLFTTAILNFSCLETGIRLEFFNKICQTESYFGALQIQEFPWNQILFVLNLMFNIWNTYVRMDFWLSSFLDI